MANPSPIVTVQDGGGGQQATTNGAVVTAGNVVTVTLSSIASVGVWSLTVVGQDDLVTPPVITVNNVAKTATFTAPALPWSLVLQSQVGINSLGKDVNGQTQPSYTTTLGIYCLTAGGARLLATNERAEGSAAYGWITKINTLIRTPAGGGSTPTGTGVTHITASVQDTNARDVSRGVCSPEDFGAVGGVAATDEAAFSKAMLAMAVQSTVTATFGGNSLARSVGSWVTDGVQVGQRIYVTAAVNAGNNGPKTVTVVTALTLTVSEALTAEVATASVVVAGPKNLLLGPTRYELQAVKTLPPLCTVMGAGDSSIVSMQSNNSIWLAGGDYTQFLNFRMIGVSVGAAQNGISTNGYSFVRISGISIGPFIGNHGIVLLNNSSANIGPVVVGCRVQNAYGTAFEVSGAQYSQLDSVQSYGCGLGIHIGAGNCLITNGNFSLDTIGANITTGDGNDAHCIFSACYFNHCTTHAITVGAIVNGAFFRGCNIYYADIVLTTSTGVIFEGCTIDVSAMYFDGSIGTQFVDCTWPMSNANTVNSGFNAHPSTEFWSPGNRTLTGAAVALGVNRRLDIEAAKTLDVYAGAVKRLSLDGNRGMLTAGGGGTDFNAAMGPQVGSESVEAALYLLGNGVAPNGTNCAVKANANDAYLNSPRAGALGTVGFLLANSTVPLSYNGTKSLGTSAYDFATAKRFANTSYGLVLANGANNNLAVTTSFARITGPTLAFSITGFVQPVDGTPAIIDGTRLTIFNTTAQAMTIANQSASSSAGNKITTMTGADVVLTARTSTANFIYDAATTSWLLLGTS